MVLISNIMKNITHALSPKSRTLIIPCLALLSGCVPMSEHNRLKAQFQQQEAYVMKHRTDVQKATRETTKVAMKLRDRELEIQCLKALSQSASKRASLAEARAKKFQAMHAKALAQKPAPAPTKQAPISLPASTPRPQRMAVDGYTINPDTNGIVLDQNVLFSPGSAKLRKTGRTVLSKLAKKINSGKYRHANVRVEGHTDSSPITRTKAVSDNWQLSGMRARAVLNHLEKAGVSSSRLSFAGYAFYKPIANGKSKSAKAKNRRVEIVLFE